MGDWPRVQQDTGGPTSGTKGLNKKSPRRLLAVVDAERELAYVLRSLTASQQTDNVMIDQRTKRAFAKLHEVRSNLEKVERRLTPAGESQPSPSLSVSDVDATNVE